MDGDTAEAPPLGEARRWRQHGRQGGYMQRRAGESLTIDAAGIPDPGLLMLRFWEAIEQHKMGQQRDQPRRHWEQLLYRTSAALCASQLQLGLQTGGQRLWLWRNAREPAWSGMATL